MAIGDAYATAATYRGLIGKSSTTDDTAIGNLLTAVSRIVDKRCGRFFGQDAAVVNRIYYPRGYGAGDAEAENPWTGIPWSRDLEVDDISTTTGLVITIDEDRDGSFSDETALASTDYELWPLNADKGPEAQPWNLIRLPAWSTKTGWPAGSRVQVTAKFGWPAVPKAIEAGVCYIASEIRLESPWATAQIPEVESAIGASESARDALDRLVRTYSRKGGVVFA